MCFIGLAVLAVGAYVIGPLLFKSHGVLLLMEGSFVRKQSHLARRRANPARRHSVFSHASHTADAQEKVHPKSSAKSFNKSESNKKLKPFHLGEKSNKEKNVEIKKEFNQNKATGRLMALFMSIFVSRWFEILVDILVLTAILIPENCEFAGIVYSAWKSRKSERFDYSAHTAGELFNMACPFLEGAVCLAHSILFVLESFVGVEIPNGLLVCILASHITCALIVFRVEFLDGEKTPRHHAAARYAVEGAVLALSIFITVAYCKTHLKYQSLILIATIMAQYLCRTLTRITKASHNRIRKKLNQASTRIFLFFAFFILCMLLGLSI
ncbi:uncharacterized protein NEMAJ01_1343 [Nematocida major]|uniref:uncharacterized protein n=1 Tax=Nematocida major TaxID=1912982 RepID=UPI002007EF33|nr:uncharacterized protein NEMAJ01_1343 [Nematocida major]KAH9386447.1 hypothetical protein NEMAJ01_1343 [Nematocida major]